MQEVQGIFVFMKLKYEDYCKTETSWNPCKCETWYREKYTFKIETRFFWTPLTNLSGLYRSVVQKRLWQTHFKTRLSIIWGHGAERKCRKWFATGFKTTWAIKKKGQNSFRLIDEWGFLENFHFLFDRFPIFHKHSRLRSQMQEGLIKRFW